MNKMAFTAVTQAATRLCFTSRSKCSSVFDNQLLKLRTNYEDLSSIRSFICSSKYMFHIYQLHSIIHLSRVYYELIV